MTVYHYRFNNILTIRAQEKSELEIAYREAVKSFEDAATKLYELLKKKEETISEQQENLKKGFSIQKIHHYASYITGLEKSIDEYQQKVSLTRSKMNFHNEKLMEKSIEVKKYEKMKEKDFNAYNEEQLRLETIVLDELSTLKFYSKENRW